MNNELHTFHTNAACERKREAGGISARYLGLGYNYRAAATMVKEFVTFYSTIIEVNKSEYFIILFNILLVFHQYCLHNHKILIKNRIQSFENYY